MRQAEDPNTSRAPAGEAAAATWLRRLLVAAVWLGLFLLLMTRALYRPLSPDEHQFVAPSVMLLREAWLPYLDYAHFHAPYAVYLNALPLLVFNHLLVAVRLMSVLCSLGFLFLVQRSVLSRARAEGLGPAAGRALAWSMVVLASFQWVFQYTTGLAWNHDNSLLALFGGVLAAGAALRRGACGRRLVLAGALLAVATGLRLSMAPAALLLVPVVAALAPSGARLRAASRVLLGGALGGLPLAAHALAAPADFWFGNMVYPQLSRQFRMEQGFTRAMDLPGKLVWIKEAILTQPTSLALIALCVIALLALGRAGRTSARERLPELLVALALLPALWIGALVPTPTWPQYSFAPLMLMVPLAGWALVLGARRSLTPVLSGLLVALLTAGFGAEAWRAELSIVPPPERAPLRMTEWGQTLSALGDARRVWTTAPLYPLSALDGALGIAPEMVNGPYGWRVAHLLSREERAARRIAGPPEALARLSGGLQPATLLVEPKDRAEGWVSELADRATRRVELSFGDVLTLETARAPDR